MTAHDIAIERSRAVIDRAYSNPKRPRKPMRTHGSDSGFSLAALIFFLTAASIFIAAAVPAYQMQAKREVEEELIFRGEEYARAIQKYQRRFGVYPSSVDQLISTNGMRFVRRAYKDPVTGKDFRLITVNPDGSLSGSKLFKQNLNAQPLFGNLQTVGQPRPVQEPQSQQQQQPQQQPQFQAQFQSFQPQRQQKGQQLGFASASMQQSRAPQQPGAGSAPNGSPASPFAAGGIVGVASDSSEKSVKVYNGREEYDEWEFLAILGQQGAAGQRQNSQQQNPQTGPGAAGPASSNPFQSQPNPFGTTQPAPGTLKSPFSFGGQAAPAPSQPSRRP